jgi:hypothetical protein
MEIRVDMVPANATVILTHYGWDDIKVYMDHIVLSVPITDVALDGISLVHQVLLRLLILSPVIGFWDWSDSVGTPPLGDYHFAGNIVKYEGNPDIHEDWESWFSSVVRIKWDIEQ